MLKEVAGSEIWFPEGAFIDRSKVLFVSQQGEKIIFIREAEIEQLVQKISQAEIRVTEIQKQLKETMERKEKAL